jgi:hypothetical protein
VIEIAYACPLCGISGDFNMRPCSTLTLSAVTEEGRVSMSPFRTLLWAAVGIAVAACSDNPTSPATVSNALDLTALLAEMSPASVNTAVHFGIPMGGMMSIEGPAFDPVRCPFDAQTEFFVCSTVTANGMTFTRMFRLIDAAGSRQSKLDTQTSAIETKRTMKGSPTNPDGEPLAPTFTLDGSSDMTLTGIGTDQHTLNGTSTATMAGTIGVNGITVPSLNSATATTKDLVLRNSKAGQTWPRSGTITFDERYYFTYPDGSLTPASSNVTMAFDGTNVVTVTITDPFGTVTCHFDMANPGSCS